MNKLLLLSIFVIMFSNVEAKEERKSRYRTYEKTSKRSSKTKEEKKKPYKKEILIIKESSFCLNVIYSRGYWDNWETNEISFSIYRLANVPWSKSVSWAIGIIGTKYWYVHPEGKTEGNFFSPSILGKIRVGFPYISLAFEYGTGYGAKFFSSEQRFSNPLVDYIRGGIVLEPIKLIEVSLWGKTIVQFKKYYTIGGGIGFKL